MTNLYKIPKIQWKGNPSGFITKNTIREYVIRPNSKTNPESSKPKMVCYNGKPQKYFDSVAEAREWVETVNYPSVVAEYLEPIGDKVYEIIYDGYDCYYSIMHSLDKLICEQFIQRVQDYDSQLKPIHDRFTNNEDVENLFEDWEQNHPLRQWSFEIHGEYDQMWYYLEEDGYKSYAKNLRIKEYNLDKAENK